MTARQSKMLPNAVAIRISPRATAPHLTVVESSGTLGTVSRCPETVTSSCGVQKLTPSIAGHGLDPQRHFVNFGSFNASPFSWFSQHYPWHTYRKPVSETATINQHENRACLTRYHKLVHAPEKVDTKLHVRRYRFLAPISGKCVMGITSEYEDKAPRRRSEFVRFLANYLILWGNLTNMAYTQNRAVTTHVIVRVSYSSVGYPSHQLVTMRAVCSVFKSHIQDVYNQNLYTTN